MSLGSERDRQALRGPDGGLSEAQELRELEVELAEAHARGLPDATRGPAGGLQTGEVARDLRSGPPEAPGGAIDPWGGPGCQMPSEGPGGPPSADPTVWVHDVWWAGQPYIYLTCRDRVGVLEPSAPDGGARGLPDGVYQRGDGLRYSFRHGLVTCPDCLAQAGRCVRNAGGSQ